MRSNRKKFTDLLTHECFSRECVHSVAIVKAFEWQFHYSSGGTFRDGERNKRNNKNIGTKKKKIR